jgi:hypothetical protein
MRKPELEGLDPSDGIEERGASEVLGLEATLLDDSRQQVRAQGLSSRKTGPAQREAFHIEHVCKVAPLAERELARADIGRQVLGELRSPCVIDLWNVGGQAHSVDVCPPSSTRPKQAKSEEVGKWARVLPARDRVPIVKHLFERNDLVRVQELNTVGGIDRLIGVEMESVAQLSEGPQTRPVERPHRRTVPETLEDGPVPTIQPPSR